MTRKMIWNDLVRNRAVSLITILFISVAAMLLSLAAILTVNLFGAVDRLMADAKTPHFMQMHTGAVDMAGLEDFVGNNRNVADFQVIPFLNVENTDLILGGNRLTDSVQDNGFCTQSSWFDFLLDMENQPVKPQPGEVYVPVCYLRDGIVNVGDPAVLCGRTFRVAGFIRDSQMNSTLASSKRFLINEADYARLAPFGNVEYLIEFRLHDLSKLSAFETAYSAAGLPANGPALTWPLFQMISAISDGIMIAILVLIGLLVVSVSLLCVRFTLLAKIEDDFREIGVMKAIGMRIWDIRGIYLAIYAVMAAIGSGFGFMLSLLFKDALLERIRLNLGGSGSPARELLLGGLGAGIVCLLILLYVNGCLRRFRCISAVQAIRFGAQDDSSHSSRIVRLSESRVVSCNFILGLKDVLARKRLYGTMLAVIILASFIMVVPQNLYHTISGDDFVTYIGVGNCDLRMDIQQTGQIGEKTQDIGRYMENDPEIADYALFVSKIFPVKLDRGETENLKVELGDHSVFPLHYAEGRLPVKETEIALSAIYADELEKRVGERITLLTSAGEKQMTVCGIYSDITNGGKTAKAVFTDTGTEPVWSLVCADLAGKDRLPDKIAEYAAHFSYAKVSSIDEYMAQTFGGTLRSVQAASRIAGIVSAVIVLLVTLLFVKLLAAKDRYSIAVLRAVGFTGSDIQRQYAWRAFLILAVGIFLGTILAGTVGEKLSAAAVSSLGAATFRFTINPLSTYLFSPLILVCSGLLATVWGTAHAGDVKLCQSIKE